MLVDRVIIYIKDLRVLKRIAILSAKRYFDTMDMVNVIMMFTKYMFTDTKPDLNTMMLELKRINSKIPIILADNREMAELLVLSGHFSRKDPPPDPTPVTMDIPPEPEMTEAVSKPSNVFDLFNKNRASIIKPGDR